MASASSSSLLEICLKTGVGLIVCFACFVQCSPYRSKNRERDGPQLVYDQKQTGDYNIQLYLKDFQVIALLGDDNLSDYDYSYDYADFTVKPSTTKQTTTTSATTVSTPTTSTSAPTAPREVSTSAPPYNNSTNKPNNVTVNINSNVYPTEVIIPHEENSTLDPNSNVASSTSSNVAADPPLPMVYSLLSTNSASSDPLLPGKIKVQIVAAPSPPMSEPSLGIVPGEDVQSDIGETILQGEISNYRRCSNGYTRDKKGRCRRVRKPGNVASQLPFGLGNIASSLASRLRLPLPQSVVNTSETAEN